MEQSSKLRCRIVMECAGGRGNSHVARYLKVRMPTVGRWRARFGKDRLAGLADAPRPGQSRKISDAKVEQVATQTLVSKSAHATHWSTRSMARHYGLTQNAIHRIWKTFYGSRHVLAIIFTTR